jgi:histidinol dehydrogenase
MIAMRRLDTSRPEFEAQLSTLLAFETAQDSGIDTVVSGILLDVKTRGDLALLENTRRFDPMELRPAAPLEIPRAML